MNFGSRRVIPSRFACYESIGIGFRGRGEILKVFFFFYIEEKGSLGPLGGKVMHRSAKDQIERMKSHF